MITTQRLNSLPRKSNQPFTRNEPWTWWTGPSLAPRRQRGAAANRRNFARAPLQGLMSRTRSGRSTMAQKGEQTRTSRLARRRRPPHRWLETASMPSTGSGQRRTILIYSEPRCRGSPQVPRALRGTTAPACPPGRGPWQGQADDGELGRPGRLCHRGRGHSQVPRALIGGPHSPQPPQARGEQGGTPDVAAADTGGNLHHPQGTCHQGPQAHKSAPERLEIPGGLHPEPVVGQ